MQENNSTQATITKVGEGLTKLVQMYSVNFEVASQLTRDLYASYPIVGHVTAYNVGGGFDSYVVTCTLQGAWKSPKIFFTVCGHEFYSTEVIITTRLKEKKLMPNIYEKTGVLGDAIKDAERRLGSYLASDGCEKTDKYAQDQIKLINGWSKQLDDILNAEVTEDGSN